MAPLDPQQSNHIKAGAFVFVSLVIFIIIVVTLAGGGDLWRASNTYNVRFTLETGATGLVPGSDVRVGGQSVGRVNAIELIYDDPNRPPVGVEARVSMSRTIPVFEDAYAFLERPLFGANSVINFPTLGGGEGASRLQSGDAVQGLIAPPELLRNAGYGPEQSLQLRNILERIDAVSERAVAMADTFEHDIVPNITSATEDVRALTGDVRLRSGVWFDRADAFTEDLSSMSAEARAGIEEARAFIASVHDVIDENRETFNATLARFESAGQRADDLLERLNTESVQLLNDMLAEGRARVEQAGSVVDRLDAMLGEHEPEVRKTVANLRLASDQLKLTMGEVRRSPWRLLYRPKTKELEYELLYDAARTYASAVSDLRAATESLESTIGGSGSRLATDGRPLSEYVDHIGRAFERYQDAETRFLDALIAQSP